MVQSNQISDGVSSETNQLSDSELRLIGAAILDHLQHESRYLDGVITCSIRMSDLLKQSSLNHAPQSDPVAPDVDHEPPVKHEFEQINRMRRQLLDQFSPIASGRDEIQVVLKKLETETKNSPSLRELAPHLEPHVRDELNRLRTEIRQKLQDIQVITLGNQAILVYTLDFYHRLMTGITGESQVVRGYNACGQITQSASNHLFEKQC